MQVPATAINVVPARVERNITATEALKTARDSAGGVEGARRYRVGLTARHPMAFAQYGPITFHKFTEKVSPNGLHRTPVKGQILDLTDKQVEDALSVARFQMVRAIGGWERPARCTEYDVRHVAAGFVSAGDRPVLVYHGAPDKPIDVKMIDMAQSLIYLEVDPRHDEAPPETLEEAVRAFAKTQDLETKSFGEPVPPPAEKGTTVDAGVSEVMGRARRAGVKMTPQGEVRS